MDPAEYVLGRYNAEQRKELPFLLEEGADAVLTWLRFGMTRAMDVHNRDPADPE
jgi:hypothetical protein